MKHGRCVNETVRQGSRLRIKDVVVADYGIEGV